MALSKRVRARAEFILESWLTIEYLLVEVDTRYRRVLLLNWSFIYAVHMKMISLNALIAPSWSHWGLLAIVRIGVVGRYSTGIAMISCGVHQTTSNAHFVKLTGHKEEQCVK
jgi:hypothetical protein